MKKTYRESHFQKAQLSSRYSRESLGKSNEVVLQTMVLNDKEVIIEVIDKDAYQNLVGKF
jgi:hypothetical protein